MKAHYPGTWEGIKPSQWASFGGDGRYRENFLFLTYQTNKTKKYDYITDVICIIIEIFIKIKH